MAIFEDRTTPAQVTMVSVARGGPQRKYWVKENAEAEEFIEALRSGKIPRPRAQMAWTTRAGHFEFDIGDEAGWPPPREASDGARGPGLGVQEREGGQAEPRTPDPEPRAPSAPRAPP